MRTSSKQTLVGTSTNHLEIIVLYEASWEYVWLCRMIDHIHIACDIGAVGSRTIIYEDNAACVAKMQTWYVNNNYTNHISPKLFYPPQLQENGEISILQTKSCDNYVDLFTKFLPIAIFNKCVKDIGMCRIKNMQGSGGEILWTSSCC
jgi:hypothetical protein